ncbi:MAG: N-acetyltransferase, partial [Alphaproteobacteria bacterium]
MKTLSIEVRRAEPQDALAVSAVHRAAWIAAYAGIIPHRSLVRMIERRREDWWRRATRGPSTVLVLEVAGKIAGYATVGRNRVDALKQEGEIYELY